MFKKIILISLLSMSMLGFSNRKHNKKIEKPSTQIKIPRCKDQNEKEKEWQQFQTELRLKGYKILRAVTSETNFSVLVEDSNGNQRVEEKIWCRLGE